MVTTICALETSLACGALPQMAEIRCLLMDSRCPILTDRTRASRKPAPAASNPWFLDPTERPRELGTRKQSHLVAPARLENAPNLPHVRCHPNVSNGLPAKWVCGADRNRNLCVALRCSSFQLRPHVDRPGRAATGSISPTSVIALSRDGVLQLCRSRFSSLANHPNIRWISSLFLKSEAARDEELVDAFPGNKHRSALRRLGRRPRCDVERYWRHYSLDSGKSSDGVLARVGTLRRIREVRANHQHEHQAGKLHRIRLRLVPSRETVSACARRNALMDAMGRERGRRSKVVRSATHAGSGSSPNQRGLAANFEANFLIIAQFKFALIRRERELSGRPRHFWRCRNWKRCAVDLAKVLNDPKSCRSKRRTVILRTLTEALGHLVLFHRAAESVGRDRSNVT
jgi:hypothetical protein